MKKVRKLLVDNAKFRPPKLIFKTFMCKLSSSFPLDKIALAAIALCDVMMTSSSTPKL